LPRAAGVCSATLHDEPLSLAGTAFAKLESSSETCTDLLTLAAKLGMSANECPFRLTNPL